MSRARRRPRLAQPAGAVTLVGLAVLAGAPRMMGAQAVTRPTAPAEEVFDSAGVLGRARREQARFEQRRLRALPATWGSGSGPCDEQVGRFCTWYDEGDWLPEPESAEVIALRAELVAYLDSVQVLLPGDDWILGQRVWYRAEAGYWDGALRMARACGGGTPWWCAALEGFALHGLGRYGESQRAFDRALDAMEPDRAERWLTPERAVDGSARGWLEDAEERGAGAAARAWLWTLADPLWLVPGNDRRTAHFARWTVSTLREDARNPFQISWGRDLEELTVRHGWEIGWERQRSTRLSVDGGVVGHKHPDGRDFMPPGDALREPTEADAADLTADRGRPKSLYAPAYAPVLLPMEGQVAVFPRADSFAVVATHYLPDDTTWRRPGPDRRPWMDPGPAVRQPARSGLFLLSASAPVAALEEPERLGRERVGSVEGGLVLRAPAGAWVLSVESWSPPARRAGRLRRGLVHEAVPPDVATLSDLLLVRAGGGDPATLEAAATRALPRAEVGAHGGIAVVWELAGLGRAPATLAYALSVERTGGNVFQRLGRTIGLVDPDRPLSLRWEEAGPDAPRAVLRGVDLELPELEPGSYQVRLSVTVSGRAPLAARTTFVVR